MSSCLIEVKIGEPVVEIESGRIGKLKDIKLVPNGVVDPRLVVVLYVEMENPNGKTSLMSATSNKFKALESFEYDEMYPSVHMNRLIEKKESEKFQEEYKPGWS